MYQVTLSVEEITKDKKVIAFKMRRRKNSKRTKGFRRDVTILRVKDITLNDSSLTDELLR
jgi:large subunit ribosomal protein L21